MKQQFIEKRFNHNNVALIENALAIIDEHQAEGYRLTIRQLFYQFVRRGLMENSEKSYNRMSNVISNARLAGLVDWDSIEDRMRFARTIPSYDSASQFFNAQLSSFAMDLWADQQHYCEVWIEKDALSGVIERPCINYRVPFFACRGYASQASLYEAGARLRKRIDMGQTVTIFHLGDHDHSGVDMTRDNEQRLNMFAQTISDVRIVRLALNKEQIERFHVPPDPTDETSWELDALPCAEIERLVMSSIEGILNLEKFILSYQREQAEKSKLSAVVGALSQ